jgi:hypothetical protein
LQIPTVTAGSFVTGDVYQILTVGSTDFTLIGASANTVGVCFTATGVGSGTGTAYALPVIKYYGTDDTAYTLAGTVYGVDEKDQYTPKVYLKYGQIWPSTSLRPYNGVCVTYKAGYGDAGSSVPEDVIYAMLLLIAHWYEHREDVTMGAVPQAMQRAVDALLSMEKVY